LSAHFGYGQNADPVDQQIAQLEKKIADLKAQLASIKEQPELIPVIPQRVWSDLIPESWIKALSWRGIGPATMSGRITAIAVYEADPTTYWVATASGGLVKTTNNGFTFTHQFDKEETVSIGDVAVAPSNKEIVWVGTGEANPRNSVSYGNGVYKSSDGGNTWKNMGLAKTFQISKVVVHPKNPDIVYVGALGRLYGPNPERGLYKTVDGGKTWKQILYADDRTGVIDIAMNRADPETLIVATWERGRDEFDSFRGDAKPVVGSDEYAPSKLYGPGGGLYRTTDGGQSFQRLSKGLPTVNLGRIGLDYSRKTPNTLIAIIDTEQAGSGVAPVQVYMGVTSENFGKEAGVKLTGITEGSPAEKAGLKENDVVVRFGDVEVKTSDGLVAEIQKRKPNDKVKVLILRGKEKKEIDLTLGTRPPAAGQRQSVSLGIEFQAVTAGLEILAVREKSAAENAGLRAGDIITRMGDTAVNTQRAVLALLVGKKPGDKLKVTFLRGKETKETELTLEQPPPALPARPWSGRLGGNLANVQDRQGPEGYQSGGIFKSADNGETWKRINSYNERPFYFSVVRIDPNDDNTIYAAGIKLSRSTNGGKTFESANLNNGVHDDQHALWIDPRDSRHLVLGSDGGFYVSYDRCAHWDHMNHAGDLGQFYHVAVDNQKPYHVYGGLQDNGSWGGPSNVIRGAGPINDDWVFVNGGDGFVCRIDPGNPDIVYAESQDGSFMRRNLKTGESGFIRPTRAPGTAPYRFNWNAPFILSSHNPGIFYCAGNYVFRSVNQGRESKPISPEITRTKRGSATTLAESPINPDVLWAGTDDGAVWVTRDGGKNWANLSANFKSAGLPGPFWVASIEASRFAEGRAYVAFDAHRSNDDNPYVFITDDFGQNWKSLKANLPWGSTRVLREDRMNSNLLYLGTEFACYASINRGASWNKLNGKSLPTVAIHEIAQPGGANEIVLATHGRSIWIMDVTALRQIKPTHLSEQAGPVLFTPSIATRWQSGSDRGYPFSSSARKYTGQNPARGAVIEYVLPKKADKATLKIEDVTGQAVMETKVPTEAGFHRTSWGLRRGQSNPSTAKDIFTQVISTADTSSGVYRVVLTVDGKTYAQPLVVEADPHAAKFTDTGADEVEEEKRLRRLLNSGSGSGREDY
jgi:photosystem II stability/assembly factor-like uncharacterized protein